MDGAIADSVYARCVISIGAFNAVVWTFLSLALVSTTLRLYTRIRIVKAFGADDGLIVFGQLAAAAFTGTSIWHIDSIRDIYRMSVEAGFLLFFESPITIMKWNIVYRSAFITDAIYLLTLPIIKCSILAFFLRIAFHRKHRWVIWGVGAAITIQAIVNLFLGIFSIDPPSAIYNPLSTPNVRIIFNYNYLQTANSSFQVLFDIIIQVLPVSVIFKTQFQRRERVALVVIYLLSFLSLAATIVRLVKVVQYAQRDNQWDAIVLRFDYTYWAVIEIMTAILCANLPTMSSLLKHISKTKSTRTTGRYGSSRFGNTDLGKASSGGSFAHRWFKNSIQSVHLMTTQDTAKKTSNSDSEKGPFSQTSSTKEKGSTSGTSTGGYDDGDTYADGIIYITPAVTDKKGEDLNYSPETHSDSKLSNGGVFDTGHAAGHADESTNTRRVAATQVSPRMAATNMKAFPPGRNNTTTVGAVQNALKDSQTGVDGGPGEDLKRSIHGGDGTVHDGAIYRTDNFDVERSAF